MFIHLSKSLYGVKKIWQKEFFGKLRVHSEINSQFLSVEAPGRIGRQFVTSQKLMVKYTSGVIR